MNQSLGHQVLRMFSCSLSAKEKKKKNKKKLPPKA
jgi:hypothetical protein